MFASEQSPQNTPARWRSTSSHAIASSSRSRYGPGPEREAHQQAPVLDRVGQVFGRQDGRVALGRRRPGRRRSPPAAPPTSRWRSTSNSGVGDLAAAPPSARRSCRPTTRNRTRWRDGPTGSSRKSSVLVRPVGERALPRQVEQRRAPLSRRRSRGNGPVDERGARSELLAQVGGDASRRSRATRTGGAPPGGGGRRSPR